MLKNSSELTIEIEEDGKGGLKIDIKKIENQFQEPNGRKAQSISWLIYIYRKDICRAAKEKCQEKMHIDCSRLLTEISEDGDVIRDSGDVTNDKAMKIIEIEILEFIE